MCVGECVGVGVPGMKLPTFSITLESYASSLASAIASFIWLVCPGVTAATQFSTVVRPSISVLMEPPPSCRSLFRYRLGFSIGAVPYGFPPFMVLIETGTGAANEPPSVAQFVPFT